MEFSDSDLMPPKDLFDRHDDGFADIQNSEPAPSLGDSTQVLLSENQPPVENLGNNENKTKITSLPARLKNWVEERRDRGERNARQRLRRQS